MRPQRRSRRIVSIETRRNRAASCSLKSWGRRASLLEWPVRQAALSGPGKRFFVFIWSKLRVPSLETREIIGGDCVLRESLEGLRVDRRDGAEWSDLYLCAALDPWVARKLSSQERTIRTFASSHSNQPSGIGPAKLLQRRRPCRGRPLRQFQNPARPGRRPCPPTASRMQRRRCQPSAAGGRSSLTG